MEGGVFFAIFLLQCPKKGLDVSLADSNTHICISRFEFCHCCNTAGVNGKLCSVVYVAGCYNYNPLKTNPPCPI